MLVNRPNLAAAFVGFKNHFQRAFDGVKPQWNRIAMEVPSTTRAETYGWMGAIPNFREWIGDRVVRNLKAHDYTIKNKSFEVTIGVDRDDFEDDQLGIYAPMFQELGRSTAAFPDTLVFNALPTGEAVACYDGQNYFDTDHPVIGADGQVASVSNHGGGAGTPWYLMDLTRAVKPLVFQNRRKFDLIAKDDVRDENVFSRKEFVYGSDGRCNVGFGLWQLAYMSKQTLDHDNYAAARAAMMSFSADGGQKLGITPTVLVCGASLEGKARQVLMNERKANGEDNEWKGTAEVFVSPLLA